MALIGLPSIGVLLPIAVLMILGLTPDIITQSGPVGTFISASTSAGGFGSSTVSTIQTSAGTVAVQGSFSAPRGSAMTIVNTVKHGLRLCAAGHPKACATLSSSWPGRLEPVPHGKHVFLALAASIGEQDAGMWLLLGMVLSFAGVLLILADSAQSTGGQQDIEGTI